MNPSAPHSTLPVNVAERPDSFHRTPAPMLGEHNHQLLREIGLTDAEIAALEDDDVIGTEPALGRKRKAAR